MTQPLYHIEANRRCRTHRPGTRIDYTGPRSAVPQGWTIIGRYHGTHTHSDGSAVTY